MNEFSGLLTFMKNEHYLPLQMKEQFYIVWEDNHRV